MVGLPGGTATEVRRRGGLAVRARGAWDSRSATALGKARPRGETAVARQLARLEQRWSASRGNAVRQGFSGRVDLRAWGPGIPGPRRWLGAATRPGCGRLSGVAGGVVSSVRAPGGVRAGRAGIRPSGPGCGAVRRFPGEVKAEAKWSDGGKDTGHGPRVRQDRDLRCVAIGHTFSMAGR